MLSQSKLLLFDHVFYSPVMGPLKRLIAKHLFLNPCTRCRAAICYSRIQRFGSSIQTTHPTFVPFDQLLEQRRQEANRSLIVQVKNENSFNDLLSYCVNFGKVRNTFYYRLMGNDDQRHFFLIEYNEKDGLEAAFVNTRHSNLDRVIPVSSPLVWFRMDTRRANIRSDLPKLNSDSNELPTDIELNTLLDNSESFDEDLKTLFNATQLGEIGTRLRFIAAMQLEQAFSSIFMNGRIFPFGSSVNSFGKMNCDLDLVFQLDTTSLQDTTRLIYHSKSLSGSGRHNLRHLEIVADILQYCLPGCSNIKRIFKARVPIIKYKHDICGLECDLSSCNLSGVFMSELLYIYASYDLRVRPLVFAVRYWAKEINITSPTPGRWVTNFMLTLMVLFHLQYEKIIPSVDKLVEHRCPEDTRTFVDENGAEITCEFARDLNALKNPGTISNKDNLLTLLYKLFEFYATFDYRSNAMSLNSGLIMPKPNYDALYIVNPLERGLNVSKNVSPEECEKMRMQFRNAAWSIDCALNISKYEKRKWGLKDLIQSHTLNKSGIPYHGGMKSNSRLSVKELFEDDDSDKPKDTSTNFNESVVS